MIFHNHLNSLLASRVSYLSPHIRSPEVETFEWVLQRGRAYDVKVIFSCSEEVFSYIKPVITSSQKITSYSFNTFEFNEVKTVPNHFYKCAIRFSISNDLARTENGTDDFLREFDSQLKDLRNAFESMEFDRQVEEVLTEDFEE